MTGVGDKAVRDCPMCEKRAVLHVRYVRINGKLVEVTRCLICDTKPCSACDKRTLDPTATHCACGQRITMADAPQTPNP